MSQSNECGRRVWTRGVKSVTALAFTQFIGKNRFQVESLKEKRRTNSPSGWLLDDKLGMNYVRET